MFKGVLDFVLVGSGGEIEIDTTSETPNTVGSEKIGVTEGENGIFWK